MTEATSVLSEEQVDSARRDGYVLVKGVKTREDCGAYLDRLDEYGRGTRAVPDGSIIQREPRVERGELAAEGVSDIRKITRVADGDKLFHHLVMTPSVVGAMQQLMSPNLKLFRADVLMKPPQVGSAKGMHQDSAYWPIEPMDLWSCWMPFDPASLENGCMVVIAESHQRGVLPHVKVTDDYVIPEEHYRVEDTVTVPMDPGDGLFFHSLLLHGTAENTSSMPRRAITMSYMATEYKYTGDKPKPDYMRISGVDVPGGV